MKKSKTENTAPRKPMELNAYTVTFKDGKKFKTKATSTNAASRRAKLEREVACDPCDVSHVDPN